MARFLQQSNMIAGGSTVVMARSPASHVVFVDRYADGTPLPIGAGELVKPSEPVRYEARGGFPLVDAIFQVWSDNINPPQPVGPAFDAKFNLNGAAWVDTVAPATAGNYRLVVSTRSNPFAPAHASQMGFVVSRSANPPREGPPENNPLAFLGKIKGFLIVGGLVVAGIYLLPTVTSYIPRGKR